MSQYEISPLVQISYYLENLDKAPTMFEVWGSPKGLWGDSCSARRQLVICRWGPPRKGSAPTQCSVHPRLFHIQPPDVAAGMQKLSRAGHIWCQGNVCSACSPVACKMFGQVAVLGGRCGAHVPLACGRGGQKVGWNQFFQLWLTPLLAARPIPTAISPHFGSNGVRLLSLLAPMSRILRSENENAQGLLPRLIFPMLNVGGRIHKSCLRPREPEVVVLWQIDSSCEVVIAHNVQSRTMWNAPREGGVRSYGP